MKNTIAVILVSLFSFSGSFACTAGVLSIPPDTIEISFGDKGKIIIQVESEKDLELLKNYDINEMLDDIDISGEADSADVIIIEDERGEKYLKSEEEESEEERVMEEMEMEESEFEDLEDEFDSRWEEQGRAGNSPVIIESNDDHVIVSHGREKQRIGAGTDFVSFIDLGMNNYLENGGFPDANDAQYTVRPWGSWYVALKGGVQTHITGKFAFDYGGGFSWYNFKYQDPDTRMVKGEDGMIFTTWDKDMKAVKSKLTATYINAHFLPVFDFGYRKRVKTYDDGTTISRVRYGRNGFRIGLGGYAGYRIGSHSKVVFKDGKKNKDKENNNFYLNNFRYGLRMIIGYGEVDFFINYDLNNLYVENRGPQLNAFTFGVSF